MTVFLQLLDTYAQNHIRWYQLLPLAHGVSAIQNLNSPSCNTAARFTLNVVHFPVCQVPKKVNSALLRVGGGRDLRRGSVTGHASLAAVCEHQGFL